MKRWKGYCNVTLLTEIRPEMCGNEKDMCKMIIDMCKMIIVNMYAFINERILLCNSISWDTTSSTNDYCKNVCVYMLFVGEGMLLYINSKCKMIKVIC